MRTITIEEARALVGQDLGVSDWLQIDQGMIDAFADLTNDHQFIHVDPERAKATPFGGTIAHGFLTLSLVPSLMPENSFTLKNMKMGLNYGFEQIRFLSPVLSGSRIRGRHKLEQFEKVGEGRFRIDTHVTLDIENTAKPALSARWINLQIV